MRVYLILFLIGFCANVYSQPKTPNVPVKANKGYLSLQQIAKQNIADLKKSSTVIFFKNDSLLLDTSGIKIPELSVFKTTVLRASKTSYYENFPDVTFLYIYTTPQPIYIR